MLLSPLLQEYLVENGHLPLPDAGQLSIQHEPAQLQAADQTFIAPESKIVFSGSTPSNAEVEKLTAFISKQLDISDKQATALLNKETVSALSNNRNVDAGQWPEWNLFLDKKNESLFGSQQSLLNDYLLSFPIEKIHRQPVTAIETTILPAESISEEPYPEINVPAPVDYLWVWTLVIFMVSALLIMFWYA